MKFRDTTFWKNYKKFNRIVGNSSMRCTTDAVVYWKLFQQFKFKKVLEIGVYQGLTSGLMLESSSATVLGIDPVKDLDVFNSVFCKEKDRFTFIKTTSQDALINGIFDFILIDGDHQIDVAHNDLLKFIPLLDKSGVLAVDDYKLVCVPEVVDTLLALGLVPFLQAEQTEFWHYPDQNRANFLDNLLVDNISKFIFMYNINLNNYTVLKAKTVEALTDNIDLFDAVLQIYNV